MSKKSRKSKNDRWLDVIIIDVFSMQIPVFLNQEDKNHTLASRGFTSFQLHSPIHGAACRDYCDDGSSLISLIIPPNSEPSTWAHEAVHVADFIMDTLGMDMELGNTETRAYITGYVFNRVSEIMEDYHGQEEKA